MELLGSDSGDSWNDKVSNNSDIEDRERKEKGIAKDGKRFRCFVVL